MSESVKKSVRLSASTVETIGQLNRDSRVNWSGSINDISNRYNLFVKHSMPDMKDPEKHALIAIYNGMLVEPHRIEEEALMMPWRIEQGIKYDTNALSVLCNDEEDSLEQELKTKNKAQKFQINVASWSISERLAALHFATSYWATKFLDDRDDLDDIDENKQT